MQCGQPDNDEPEAPQDRPNVSPRNLPLTGGSHHGEGSTFGSNLDPRLPGRNVSDLRSHVSGIFERSLLNSPQPPENTQRHGWHHASSSTNAWPTVDGRLPTPSRQDGDRAPVGRYATTTDGDMERSHLGSDEESVGGEPMEGDDDDMRRGSYGADDMTITPQDGHLDGDSTMTLENRRKRQSLRRGTACVRCRSKKLKCTGERPTCSVCANSKKPVSCVYEEPPKKIPKIQRRQTRLQQIEAQIEERTQELEALRSAPMTSVASVPPIPEIHMGNMSHLMPMPTRTMPNFGDPSFPSGSSSATTSNVPMSYTARSSFQTMDTPLHHPGSFPPMDNSAYAVSSDVTQVASPFKQQPFYGQAYEGFMPQQSYVSELPAMTSGSRHGQRLSFAHGTNSPQAPLTSFLAEAAGFKQQGSTYNPEIPAYIMSKYGNDVMKAIELTIFLSSRGLTFTDGQVDVAVGSPMEYALLYVTLPHIEHLCIPLHPQRFLDSLILPANTRPHPALLYILFAEASRIISKGTPLPYGSKNVYDSHSKPDVALLQHARDLHEPFFERSQTLLREGLQQLDRPLDLLKAGTIICRYLVRCGRSVEAWSSPCLRLVVACGLHRITSPVIRAPTPEREPLASPGSGLGLRDQNAHSTDYGRMYDHSTQARQSAPSGSTWQMHGESPLSPQPHRSKGRRRSHLPKPVIIPPAADDIEIWERIELFWAVKELDWGMSSHFSWTVAISDGEIQTPWPQPRTDYERGTVDERMVGGICELLQPRSSIATPQTQSPRVLALKSLCLLHQASRLSDLPHPPAVLHSAQREPLQPGYVRMPLPMTAQALVDLQTALEAFKAHDMPSVNQIPVNWAPNQWWICARANLAVAEMFFFREYAVYKPIMHENAVASARRIVDLVKSLSDETYANLHIWVPMNITAIANFLSHEVQRLRSSEQPGVQQAALVAEQDLHLLQRVLNVDIGKWQDSAKLQAMMHQRFRDGLQERFGQYERAF